ncbi:family 16 glycosylhydrolase [Leptotrichia sp. oral taxon 879]|uniref:glycoside hydrolase family 16 protein n=1 Tax=Leptotrichia sp. oral taxon 879 TaxID=1227267 RepID=UPI0003FF7661|nr:glycoside hydrolase family 16 protein [Leptotrichia sp. oral taxon 879]
MKKMFLGAILLIIIGNTVFAAGEENIGVKNEGRMEVREKEIQDISRKTENIEIVKEEGRKKSKKNKINSFISKIKGKEWKLVWYDEFNGSQLDTKKWDYWDYGNPWNPGNYLDENGNLVNQYGFDAKHYYLKDNVKIENGNMVIKLKKETNKKVNVNGTERRILYSSGAVHTRNTYNIQYGKIEMRAAMPEGVGTWPAFWMWPAGYSQASGGPAIGEIDIVETYGNDMRRATGTLHVLKSDNTYETFDGDDYKLSKWPREKLTNFNTYAVEWDDKEIKWLFNNKVYKKFSYKELERKGLQNPFNQPYFIIINVALSKITGEDGDVDFPTEMKVDYVRVYQKK